MSRTDLNFLKSMFINFDLNDLYILIINQTTPDKCLESTSPNIKVVNAFETGLSKSRNLALEHTNADIALFADDDIKYLPNVLEDVEEAYMSFPDAALISFQYQNENGELQKLYQVESGYQNSKLHKQSLSSIEMSIKPKLMKEKKINFNTCFGLGERFVCGEEQVFRDELVRQNLKVVFVAKPIVKHFGKTSVPPEYSQAYTEAIVAQKYLEHNNLIYLWLIRYIWKLMSRKVIGFSDIINIWRYGKTAVRDYKANCSR
jgi:glycosyltransferase involved in cell wall biosynthesis